ncbi:MAG: histidine kinase [Acidobacteriota bacterium]|jgi:sensor histidine kinase YesM
MSGRGLLREIAFAFSSALLALLLLYYLHGELLPYWALGCGLVAGVLLRHALAPNYATFPNFLRRPLNLAVVLIGTIFAVWATLAAPRYSNRFYWISVQSQALTLVAAGMLLGLVVAALVYTHARMRHEVEESRIRESILRESALRAQLKALQAQINPHFLFNALNALAELTHDDPDHAEELIGDLSFLLRYSLRSSAVETVPLVQELEAVDRYLRIEQARLGGRLTVKRDVDTTLTDTRVPGLILQPIVENAVQHGVAVRPEGGHVSIAVGRDAGGLHIVVEDDGPGLPDEIVEKLGGFAAVAALAGVERAVDTGTAGAGGGLVNVQKRLALSFRGAARMSVTRSVDGGTRVDLEVPL